MWGNEQTTEGAEGAHGMKWGFARDGSPMALNASPRGANMII